MTNHASPNALFMKIPAECSWFSINFCNINWWAINCTEVCCHVSCMNFLCFWIKKLEHFLMAGFYRPLLVHIHVSRLTHDFYVLLNKNFINKYIKNQQMLRFYYQWLFIKVAVFWYVECVDFRYKNLLSHIHIHFQKIPSDVFYKVTIHDKVLNIPYHVIFIIFICVVFKLWISSF